MNRLYALHLSGATLLSPGLEAPVKPAARALRLPELAFSVGVNPYRGIGVLVDEPVLVVQDLRGTENRLTIPRADLEGEPRWRLTPEPARAPTTKVDAVPHSDVTYAPIPDGATALCRGTGGVSVAMLAHPRFPCLVHYHAAKNEFRTHPLPSSQSVIVVFEQPGRVNFFVAGATDLRVVEAVTL
ncbi:MAG: hypothetical protein M3154_02490 [Candidatus Eremiobacteraeota bacterium]|nr:hypothetical protein [Candidatus Eremiobacteraeota bacterium]